MMIEYEQALDAILNNSKELPEEKALIENSVGRVLVEDIYSKIEMPPFNKSAMDGYAVKSINIESVPTKLKCIGSVEAGQTFRGKARSGGCVKIMTGAVLPEGSDSVVEVEDVSQVGKCIEINKSVKRWQNICFKGEDIKRGQRVLEKGTVISISDVALLATVGRSLVKVVKKPEAAILNTGGEIVPVGHKLSKRKIYNSNGPQLLALLKSDGINPYFLGIAKDHPKELTKAIKKGLEGDILLISGGVSMGDYDLVPGILKELGVKEIFHKINIKPGKPLFFGRKKKTLIFGIPGNPVSTFLVYHIFIKSTLDKMMGLRQCEPKFEEGIIDKEFHRKPGRKHFVLVKVLKKASRYCITPVESHGSADTLALSKADGFMVVDENIRVVKANSKIKFITWKRKK